jgi:carbohydrate kinase (thermoresistant glucokinase family)
MIVNLMGVAGCGKTTVAELLSPRLGLPVFDGDAFHTPEHVERMRRGVPLDDQARYPWLKAIGSHMRQTADSGGGGIYTCSALKASYREILRSDCPAVRFVYLKVSRPVLAARMTKRTGHFMPASLLESQLQALEEPSASEAICINADPPPEEVTLAIVEALARL